MKVNKKKLRADRVRNTLKRRKDQALKKYEDFNNIMEME